MASLRPSPRMRPTMLLAAIVCSVSLLTGCLNAAQSEVLTALNNDRTAHRLAALPTQADAQKKAQAWAEKLARDGKLSHSRLADGIGVRWCSLGENVGYGASVPAVQNAYMNSSGHRANILASKWNGVGVGHAVRGNTVYTVQVFIQTC